MLETGRACISCGVRKYLKDFTITGEICNSCDKKNFNKMQKERVYLNSLYRNMSAKVKKCRKCGEYFKHRGVYKWCGICRNEKGMIKEGLSTVVNG